MGLFKRFLVGYVEEDADFVKLVRYYSDDHVSIGWGVMVCFELGLRVETG